ncbi:MAG: hypothetical protein R2705_21990 [Ilumatobacteraceae bacterium]
MQVPELRSPVARAVVPVLTGLVFLAVLAGVLWGVASWLSDGTADVRLGDDRFEVGRVDLVADRIAADGPLLYPDLTAPDGARSIVIDHVPGSDTSGWLVFRPFPADRPGTDCLAAQIPETRTFRDCDGRVLDVAELQPARDVFPQVDDQTTLFLDFTPG